MKQRVDYVYAKGLIKYRVFNGGIQINLNSILKQIAKVEKIEYSNELKLTFISYIHKDKISPTIFKVRSGTDATIIRNSVSDDGKQKPIFGIPNQEVKNRQKLNHDTVIPERWTVEGFLDYYDKIHTQSYGIGSIEAHQNSVALKSPHNRMKFLVNKFKMLKLDQSEVRKYIDWVFLNKSKKFTIGINFLTTDSCIQDWLNNRHKKETKKRNGWAK